MKTTKTEVFLISIIILNILFLIYSFVENYEVKYIFIWFYFIVLKYPIKPFFIVVFFTSLIMYINFLIYYELVIKKR